MVEATVWRSRRTAESFLLRQLSDLIAHSRFVTMDLGVSCFIFISFYHFWQFCRIRRNWKHLLASGLALGLALGAKYIAVVVIPVFPLILLITRPPVEEENPSPPPFSLFRAAGYLAMLFAVAAAMLWATYFFTRDPLVYWHGMQAIRATRTADFDFYMFGQFKRGGWTSYFLLSFLTKTQIPFS